MTTKSEHLFDLADVCGYFGFSESTVRRKVQDSRNGLGNFPLPLFRSGHRLLWRREDILFWLGEDDEAIALAPSVPTESND